MQNKKALLHAVSPSPAVTPAYFSPPSLNSQSHRLVPVPSFSPSHSTMSSPPSHAYVPRQPSVGDSSLAVTTIGPDSSQPVGSTKSSSLHSVCWGAPPTPAPGVLPPES